MENNQPLIVPIKGMHCKSCEILIEDELGSVQGVKEAKANWHNSSVHIKYEGLEPDQKHIAAAIERAGYELGQDGPAGFFSRNRSDYRNLGLAFLLLVVLYFILKGLGLDNLNFNLKGDLTVPLILVIGLTAGFSTCMALVGGLLLGISARYSKLHPEARASQKIYPHLLFNLGRLLSYVILGGVLGVLGSAFQLSTPVLGFITIAVGLVMLIMGLQLINIFPWAEKIRFTLPTGLIRFFGLKEHQSRVYSHYNSVVLGALTFFLPCGFTQAMQVYAISTGNFWGGAIVMGSFVLGTMPGLLSIGGLSSAVKGMWAKRFFSFAGLAVIIFAFINITSGFNLTGIDLSSVQFEKKTETVLDPNVTLEDNFQVVHMTENGNGYSPNSFTIKKGVPVKWLINATAPHSCASALIVQKYKIRKFLTAGENEVDFTPTEVGRIPFSCSMGMYTGVFNVVE